MKPHRKTDADRLYHYMFALFAHMYKKWQDSDVKTNTTIKGSIIRGLGTLITGVGSSCSEAAPQVRVFRLGSVNGSDYDLSLQLFCGRRLLSRKLATPRSPLGLCY